MYVDGPIKNVWSWPVKNVWGDGHRLGCQKSVALQLSLAGLEELVSKNVQLHV